MSGDSEQTAVTVRLRGDGFSEAQLRTATSLYERGYGEVESDRLVLSAQETLFLLEEGVVKVVDENGSAMSFGSLMDRYVKALPSFWTLYIVYRDLRKRGYLVKPGFGGELAYRVYEKGRRDVAKYVIHPLFEGRPDTTGNLLNATKLSMSKGKVFVLAVVERRGEVIYYQCTATPPVKD
ncbi:MAG: hypothetical protein NZ920_04710 [Aigarchaeota archaeon]|nr:hypothetical protein [Aigarchaeota archaeon]MDW8093240.1 hypothetical protein [Nitrososphaerota archaeon]